MNDRGWSLFRKGLARRRKEVRWLRGMMALAVFLTAFVLLFQDNINEYVMQNNYRDYGRWLFRVDEGESLAEYLRAQLMQEEFPARDRKILDFMLESLDSRGYMTEDPDYIAKAYGVSTEDVERLLGIIKRLDPAGVGARNLSECLLLQAQRSGILTPLLESLITGL